MNYVGIDLHKKSLVVAVVSENALVVKPRRFACRDVALVWQLFRDLVPFQAVIEASSSYRWLYDLLSPLGDVVLAHPLRLRAIVAGRAKTDKLDATLLATLLSAGLIPRAYVPPKHYAQLRELVRARTRLSRHCVQAKNELHALLARKNMYSPYKTVFCQRGRWWLESQDFGEVSNAVRDELLRRIEYYTQELARLDSTLVSLADAFPEMESLLDIHGIGLYSALLIVGEIGEPWRFPDGRKVGAYAGLTARVSQSGDHAYYGHITRQGSPLLRWTLIQIAMKVVRHDHQLKNFYTRIRKRSSAKIARVAVARKLAGICWSRLMKWHLANAA